MAELRKPIDTETIAISGVDGELYDVDGSFDLIPLVVDSNAGDSTLIYEKYTISATETITVDYGVNPVRFLIENNMIPNDGSEVSLAYVITLFSGETLSRTVTVTYTVRPAVELAEATAQPLNVENARTIRLEIAPNVFIDVTSPGTFSATLANLVHNEDTDNQQRIIVYANDTPTIRYPEQESMITVIEEGEVGIGELTPIVHLNGVRENYKRLDVKIKNQSGTYSFANDVNPYPELISNNLLIPNDVTQITYTITSNEGIEIHPSTTFYVTFIPIVRQTASEAPTPEFTGGTAEILNEIKDVSAAENFIVGDSSSSVRIVMTTQSEVKMENIQFLRTTKTSDTQPQTNIILLGKTTPTLLSPVPYSVISITDPNALIPKLSIACGDITYEELEVQIDGIHKVLRFAAGVSPFNEIRHYLKTDEINTVIYRVKLHHYETIETIFFLKISEYIDVVLTNPSTSTIESDQSTFDINLEENNALKELRLFIRTPGLINNYSAFQIDDDLTTQRSLSIYSKDTPYISYPDSNQDIITSNIDDLIPVVKLNGVITSYDSITVTLLSGMEFEVPPNKSPGYTLIRSGALEVDETTPLKLSYSIRRNDYVIKTLSFSVRLISSAFVEFIYPAHDSLITVNAPEDLNPRFKVNTSERTDYSSLFVSANGGVNTLTITDSTKNILELLVNAGYITLGNSTPIDVAYTLVADGNIAVGTRTFRAVYPDHTSEITSPENLSTFSLTKASQLDLIVRDDIGDVEVTSFVIRIPGDVDLTYDLANPNLTPFIYLTSLNLLSHGGQYTLRYTAITNDRTGGSSTLITNFTFTVDLCLPPSVKFASYSGSSTLIQRVNYDDVYALPLINIAYHAGDYTSPETSNSRNQFFIRFLDTDIGPGFDTRTLGVYDTLIDYSTILSSAKIGIYNIEMTARNAFGFPSYPLNWEIRLSGKLEKSGTVSIPVYLPIGSSTVDERLQILQEAIFTSGVTFNGRNSIVGEEINFRTVIDDEVESMKLGVYTNIVIYADYTGNDSQLNSSLVVDQIILTQRAPVLSFTKTTTIISPVIFELGNHSSLGNRIIQAAVSIDDRNTYDENSISVSTSYDDRVANEEIGLLNDVVLTVKRHPGTDVETTSTIIIPFVRIDDSRMSFTNIDVTSHPIKNICFPILDVIKHKIGDTITIRFPTHSTVHFSDFWYIAAGVTTSGKPTAKFIPMRDRISFTDSIMSSLYPNATFEDIAYDTIGEVTYGPTSFIEAERRVLGEPLTERDIDNLKAKFRVDEIYYLNSLGQATQITNVEDIILYDYLRVILDNQDRIVLDIQNNDSFEPKFRIDLENLRSLGYSLIEKISFKIGDFIIDEQDGAWMENWTRLTSKPGTRAVIDTLTGATPQKLASMSSDGLNLYLPLTFFFCRNSKFAIPVLTLQDADIYIEIDIHTTDGFQGKYMNPYIPGREFNVTRGVELVSLHLLTDYIQVGTDERQNLFDNAFHEILYDQVSVVGRKDIGITQTKVSITITTLHPVRELFWYVRYKDGGSNTYLNDIIDATIYLDSETRQATRSAGYYSLISKYQHHSNGDNLITMNNATYHYSFAIKPELQVPSGSCNFSRISNGSLSITLKKSHAEREIVVYAMSHNVLQLANNQGAPIFT